MEANKRLYKSNQDKIIDGVCAGVAEYIGLDPNLVRVIWIAMIFFGGSGLLLYLAGVIIIPRNPDTTGAAMQTRDRSPLFGMTLVLIGGLLLLSNLDLFDWFEWHLSWRILLPVLFMVIGGWLLLDYGQKRRSSASEGDLADQRAGADDGLRHPGSRTLYRSIRDKKILGVCGGLAEYFDVDASLMRIFWVLLLFASLGTALILYFLLGIILPRDVSTPSPIQ